MAELLTQKQIISAISQRTGATEGRVEKILDALEELINKLFFAWIENSNDQIMVTNQRQASLLHKAKKELEDVIQAVEDGVPVDIAQIDFTGAWDTLGEITGESAPDELITQLFSQFCLGK